MLRGVSARYLEQNFREGHVLYLMVWALHLFLSFSKKKNLCRKIAFTQIVFKFIPLLIPNYDRRYLRG